MDAFRKQRRFRARTALHALIHVRRRTLSSQEHPCVGVRPVLAACSSRSLSWRSLPVQIIPGLPSHRRPPGPTRSLFSAATGGGDEGAAARVIDSAVASHGGAEALRRATVV